MIVETSLMAQMKGIEMQNSIPTVNAISNHSFAAILATLGHFSSPNMLTLPKMVLQTWLMAQMKGIVLHNPIPAVNVLFNHGLLAISAIFGHFLAQNVNLVKNDRRATENGSIERY